MSPVRGQEGTSTRTAVQQHEKQRWMECQPARRGRNAENADEQKTCTDQSQPPQAPRMHSCHSLRGQGVLRWCGAGRFCCWCFVGRPVDFFLFFFSVCFTQRCSRAQAQKTQSTRCKRCALCCCIHPRFTPLPLCVEARPNPGEGSRQQRAAGAICSKAASNYISGVIVGFGVTGELPCCLTCRHAFASRADSLTRTALCTRSPLLTFRLASASLLQLSLL